MSINKKAIELLEENKYDESFKLFQEAVEQSRDIQSLTNLAWIYCYEEYEDSKAIPLLKEAVNMNPSSYFPYNLFGEIYIRQEKWNESKDILQKSINIEPSIEAYNNLAIANFHLEEIKEASRYFLLAADSSDFALYSYVYCLIRMGARDKAISKLGTFSEEDDEFVGEVDIADLYVELNLYKEAAYWFEKGWDKYWKRPDWISRYIYSLFKLEKMELANKIILKVINEKKLEIKETYEEECDEYWTESDKQEHIKELFDEIVEYESMSKRIINGFVPSMEFNTSIKTGCYLFGCLRHNHPEYNVR